MSAETNPYVVTASGLDVNAGTPGVGADSKYGSFRDIKGLGRVLGYLLLACAVASALLGMAYVLYYSVLTTFEVDLNYARAEQVERALGGIAILVLVVYIATFITFGMWTIRAMKNTWALNEAKHGGSDHLMSPVASLAWYFCPIANLWKPLQAVQQMRDVAFGLEKGMKLAPWWWTWIIARFLSRISGKLPLDTIDELMVSSMFDAVTSVIDIACAILAYFVITKMTRRQQELAAELEASTV